MADHAPISGVTDAVDEARCRGFTDHPPGPFFRSVLQRIEQDRLAYPPSPRDKSDPFMKTRSFVECESKILDDFRTSDEHRRGGTQRGTERVLLSVHGTDPSWAAII